MRIRIDGLSPYLSPKIWEPGSLMDVSTQIARKQINSSFVFLYYLGSKRIGWCPLTLRSSTLLSSLIQMVIFSGNTLTDTTRNNVSTIWASLSPIKLTHKINDHLYIANTFTQSMVCHFVFLMVSFDFDEKKFFFFYGSYFFCPA